MSSMTESSWAWVRHHWGVEHVQHMWCTLQEGLVYARKRTCWGLAIGPSRDRLLRKVHNIFFKLLIPCGSCICKGGGGWWRWPVVFPAWPNCAFGGLSVLILGWRQLRGGMRGIVGAEHSRWKLTLCESLSQVAVPPGGGWTPVAVRVTLV